MYVYIYIQNIYIYIYVYIYILRSGSMSSNATATSQKARRRSLPGCNFLHTKPLGAGLISHSFVPQTQHVNLSRVLWSAALQAATTHGDVYPKI